MRLKWKMWKKPIFVGMITNTFCPDYRASTQLSKVPTDPELFWFEYRANLGRFRQVYRAVYENVEPWEFQVTIKSRSTGSPILS